MPRHAPDHVGDNQAAIPKGAGASWGPQCDCGHVRSLIRSDLAATGRETGIDGWSPTPKIGISFQWEYSARAGLPRQAAVLVAGGEAGGNI